MIFVSRTDNGERMEYRDGKRWLWCLSVLSPTVPSLAVLLLAWTANPLFALMPVIVYFGVVPLLDALIGEDMNNPPDEVVEALSADQY